MDSSTVKNKPRVSITETKNMENKVQVYVELELKFVKRVAGNDPQLSEKELEKLRKWLQLQANNSHPFSDQHITHSWELLFFCMWLSDDKPLIQEKLAESMASMLHLFDRKDVSIRFYGAFLKVMGNKWFGIDRWRIDNSMMLVRRVTREAFVVLHAQKWDKQLIKQLNDHVGKSILDNSTSNGFLMHFTEIFLEELAKVSVGQISTSSVTLLMQPFAMCVATQRDPKVVAHTTTHIFDGLLYQSDLGRAYTETFDVGKSIGFPITSIDELQRVCDENTNDLAGRVDLVVPEIPFDPKDIIRKLKQWKYGRHTNVKGRMMIREIIDRYAKFATGNFSLGIQNMKIKEIDPINVPNIEDEAEEMIDTESDLHQPSIDVNKCSKKKRKTVLSGTEIPPPKKIKLRKAQDSKLKKKKAVQTDQWVETDLTPEEMFLDVSNACPDQPMNSSSVDPDMENVINSTTGTFTLRDGWDTLLQESEAVNFISKSHRKQRRIDDANKNWFRFDDSHSNQYASPAAGRRNLNTTLTSTPLTPSTSNRPFTPFTPSNGEKKVKIMLELNRSQETSEYIRQLRSSPKIPYDSAKKPGKGLLKSENSFRKISGIIGKIWENTEFGENKENEGKMMGQ